MAVWSEVWLSELAAGLRFDAEYYQPYLLTYEKLLRNAPHPVRPLGDLVRNGYRVVYENTEILEPDGGKPPGNAVMFLQADDIYRSFPAINAAGMGWVSRKDWERYEKGRIIPGEILIEVKGRARKVAIVPDDFSPETLVTGSVFKLQTEPELLDPYFLLAYLLSRFGVGFRFRCLTNTLIGFVNKDELYAIPVIVPSIEQQQIVANKVRRAVASWRCASTAMDNAEAKLTQALGLDHLDLSTQLCYSRSFRDFQEEGRFDAEYFMPCKRRVLDALARIPHRAVADHAPGIREMWNPARARRGEMVRNFDLSDALEPFLGDDVEPQTAGEIGSTKKQFRAGDVVVSRLRSYLKEIAIVQASGALPAVGSSEFIVLRPHGNGLSAETLMVFLRCRLVQTVLKWSQDGSNHPRFNEELLLSIPVPDVLLGVQERIDELVRASRDARRESARLLHEAKKTIEDMILGKAAFPTQATDSLNGAPRQ